MKWMELNLDTFKRGLGTAAILLTIGVMLSWPIEYSFPAFLESISPLKETWWRLSILFACLLGLSVFCFRYSKVLAQYIGTFAFIIALYPLLGMFSGFPRDLGVAALFYLLGWMALIISMSGFLCVKLLSVLAPILMPENR